MRSVRARMILSPHIAALLPPLPLAPQLLEGVFLYCTLWSVGAQIVQRPDAPERTRFDSLLKKLAGMGTVDSDAVAAHQLPSRSLYDYCFKATEGGWRAWSMAVGGRAGQAAGMCGAGACHLSGQAGRGSSAAADW